MLLSHKKLISYMKNIRYLKVDKLKGKKILTYQGTKVFLKGRKPVLFVNFGQFPCSWIRIRIRIPNKDPDPQHCIKHSNMSRKIVGAG